MCEMCGNAPGNHAMRKGGETLNVCKDCFVPLLAGGWDD
jgi:hypothetical protein